MVNFSHFISADADLDKGPFLTGANPLISYHIGQTKENLIRGNYLQALRHYQEALTLQKVNGQIYSLEAVPIQTIHQLSALLARSD